MDKASIIIDGEIMKHVMDGRIPVRFMQIASGLNSESVEMRLSI